MARHATKSSFRQCQCRWCGKRPNSPECPVTTEMRRAIRDYANFNGRNWRSSLIRLWESGDLISPELQQARNIIGPRGLSGITPFMLSRVE